MYICFFSNVFFSFAFNACIRSFRLFPEAFNPRWIPRCFESISTLAVVIWKRNWRYDYPRGVAAVAAALELIFKQQLKSANVVPVVKMTLLRAPPSHGLTQYHPLSKLTEAAAYAASRCSRHKTAKSLTMEKRIPRHIQRQWNILHRTNNFLFKSFNGWF